MDSQSLDYWMVQGNYMPHHHNQHHNHHQTAIFELPPDLSKVPSLSGSPVSTTYDQFPAPMPQEYYPQMPGEPMTFGTYPLPMTPPDFSSDHDSPYCSPRPLPPPQVEPVFAQAAQAPTPAERTHTTSGRRRAQNRAAQRAFRERKEKHARDLEAQLAALTEKHNKLETSYSELNARYEKARKTIELLTQDDGAEGDDEDGTSRTLRRRSSNSEKLRKVLDILHGDFKGVTVKTESL